MSIEIRRSGTAKGGPSKYRGVIWHKSNGKWEARIYEAGKQRFLGYFTSETAAAEAYDTRAVHLHGSNAKVNFPHLFEATKNNAPASKLLSRRSSCKSMTEGTRRGQVKHKRAMWESEESEGSIQLSDESSAASGNLEQDCKSEENRPKQIKKSETSSDADSSTVCNLELETGAIEVLAALKKGSSRQPSPDFVPDMGIKKGNQASSSSQNGSPSQRCARKPLVWMPMPKRASAELLTSAVYLSKAPVPQKKPTLHNGERLPSVESDNTQDTHYGKYADLNLPRDSSPLPLKWRDNKGIHKDLLPTKFARQDISPAAYQGMLGLSQIQEPMKEFEDMQSPFAHFPGFNHPQTKEFGLGFRREPSPGPFGELEGVHDRSVDSPKVTQKEAICPRLTRPSLQSCMTFRPQHAFLPELGLEKSLRRTTSSPQGKNIQRKRMSQPGSRACNSNQNERFVHTTDEILFDPASQTWQAMIKFGNSKFDLGAFLNYKEALVAFSTASKLLTQVSAQNNQIKKCMSERMPSIETHGSHLIEPTGKVLDSSSLIRANSCRKPNLYAGPIPKRQRAF